MKDNYQVAIIIISYNTRDLLLECVKSAIESSKTTSTEIIVIDNASEDQSYEAVCKNFPQVIAIRNPINIGFGSACNQAIQATTAPLILLLNSDAHLNQGAFNSLVKCMASEPKCGAAGCRLVNQEGTEITNAWNFLTPLNQPLELLGIPLFNRSRKISLDSHNRDCSVDWVSGACLMLRRAALDQVGLFDQRFFMYSEEEDLCYRLKKHGWSVCYQADQAVLHHGGASATTRINLLRQFYASQLLLLTKHHSHISAAFFALAMKSALLLKQLACRARGNNQIELAQQRLALKQACSEHFRHTHQFANQHRLYQNKMRGG
jgi:N-acetylglucosaminyl-diphospho-decaprenol L-rhamnosyltransferase